MALLGVGLGGACSRPPPIQVDGVYTVRIGSPATMLLEHAAAAPRGNAERRRRLTEMFREVGCDLLEEQIGNRQELPDVVCVLAGVGEGKIVVSANYDESRRRRVPDNWLGAAMLPSLYHSLSVAERQHTYVFVGLAGSYPERPCGRSAEEHHGSRQPAGAAHRRSRRMERAR